MTPAELAAAARNDAALVGRLLPIFGETLSEKMARAVRDCPDPEVRVKLAAIVAQADGLYTHLERLRDDLATEGAEGAY